MERPLHNITAIQTSIFTPRRLTALAVAIGLQLAFVWALSTGLAATLVERLPDVLKAEVLPEKLPDKTPPPPPPDLKEPPPPYVPPPDFVIQTDAPATTAITTQSHVATPQISTPASIGRPHFCGNQYPSISLRLGEEGTTTLGFRIGTDGSVVDPHITNSSGSQRLDNAAIECVSSWRYRAAVQNGQPVEVPWQANVVWRLPR